MPKLKFVGTVKMVRYTGDEVDCRTGDIIEVSQEKCDQLMTDFPMWFDKDIETVVEKPEPIIVEESISKKEVFELANKNEISMFNRTSEEVEEILEEKEIIEKPKKKPVRRRKKRTRK